MPLMVLFFLLEKIWVDEWEELQFILQLKDKISEGVLNNSRVSSMFRTHSYAHRHSVRELPWKSTYLESSYNTHILCAI